MGSWGDELWDRYPCVLDHVTSGVDELTIVLAKMVKERGEVEKEYARNIRKLVTKYTNKMEDKNKDVEEQTTYNRALRLILQEMGYQAGQHELLAESFCKIIPGELEEKAIQVSEATQENLKEVKRISEYRERCQLMLDKAKKKYQKSFLESNEAEKNYLKADSNSTISRNEIAKLKRTSDSLTAQCEDYRGTYASELMKTNKNQSEYYYKDLPAVINSLQNIEIGRIDFVKYALDQCVAAEKQVAHIIDKCSEDMENAIQMIDPVADSDLLIDRVKTGNVPPHDLPFEESPCKEKVGRLRRNRSEQKLNKQPRLTELFPRKRETEEKISVIDSEIQKGQTEIKALRVMIQSYTQNPSFGDPFTFQKELDSSILKVQKLEAELLPLNLLLNEVNDQLIEKKSSRRSPLQKPRTSHKSLSDSPEGSRTSSAGYGTISNYSGSDSDSLGHSELGQEVVVALYEYDGECSDSSIAMEAGEEFIVTEVDEGGWTKVRRKSRNTEGHQGFVPSAYLRLV